MGIAIKRLILTKQQFATMPRYPSPSRPAVQLVSEETAPCQ